jgi:hypothetical protein
MSGARLCHQKACEPRNHVAPLLATQRERVHRDGFSETEATNRIREEHAFVIAADEPLRVELLLATPVP